MVVRFPGFIPDLTDEQIQGAFFQFANFAFTKSAQAGAEFMHFRTNRKIGNISLPAVYEENHSDTMSLTSHPIQYGSPVSDHVYPQPAKLIITTALSDCVLSNFFQNTLSSWLTQYRSSDVVGDNLFPSTTNDFNTPSRIFYNVFLRMKNLREPVSVITTKRKYDNMIITGIQTKTTLETNYVSELVITMQEVFIARLAYVDIPPERQRDNKKTADTSDNGQSQTQPVENDGSKGNKSVLDKLFGGGYN